MVASYPRLTSLRRLDSCTRWTRLNLRAVQGRIACYIPCRGLSVSSHRFLVPPHPHVRVVHVLGSSWCLVRCRAQRRRYVDRWQLSMRSLSALGLQPNQRKLVVCTAFLRHHLFLGLARIHLHRRTQSRNECLHWSRHHSPTVLRTVRVLFGTSP